MKIIKKKTENLIEKWEKDKTTYKRNNTARNMKTCSNSYLEKANFIRKYYYVHKMAKIINSYTPKY